MIPLLTALALLACGVLAGPAGPPTPPPAGPGPLAGLTAHPLKRVPGAIDNPLKGPIPFSFPGEEYVRGYPYSMEWSYFALSDLMLDWNRYDWSAMEKMMSAAAARGNHSALRVYVEYPDKPSGIPAFLRKSGIAIRKTKQWNTESPDYDDERTIKALTHFIAAWGKKYDGDPRIGFITLGLVGLWGEWHLWPNEDLFPKDRSVHRYLDAFTQAFKSTKLLVRYPRVGSGYAVGKSIGFHDDSFAFKDVDKGQRKSLTMPTSEGGFEWGFLEEALKFGGENQWITESIGAELRPEIQQTLFTDKERVDDLPAVVGLSHVSWMIAHKSIGKFRAGDPHMDAFVRGMGYDLWAQAAYFKDALKYGDALKLSVTIANDGVARFYYPWKVLVGLKDINGRLARVWETNWDISQVQPRRIRAFKDWKLGPGKETLLFGAPRTYSFSQSKPGVNEGTYKLCIRVKNPMEGFPEARLRASGGVEPDESVSSPKALRFSNATQAADGWLELGTVKVSGTKASSK